MQLPYRVIIHDEKYQIEGKRVISFEMEDPGVSTKIKQLGLIPELGYLNSLMARLQDQFQLDPNENIIIEGKPNDLTYLMMIRWGLQNGSIRFEDDAEGETLMVYSDSTELI